MIRWAIERVCILEARWRCGWLRAHGAPPRTPVWLGFGKRGCPVGSPRVGVARALQGAGSLTICPRRDFANNFRPVSLTGRAPRGPPCAPLFALFTCSRLNLVKHVVPPGVRTRLHCARKHDRFIGGGRWWQLGFIIGISRLQVLSLDDLFEPPPTYGVTMADCVHGQLLFDFS